MNNYYCNFLNKECYYWYPHNELLLHFLSKECNNPHLEAAKY